MWLERSGVGGSEEEEEGEKQEGRGRKREFYNVGFVLIQVP